MSPVDMKRAINAAPVGLLIPEYRHTQSTFKPPYRNQKDRYRIDIGESDHHNAQDIREIFYVTMRTVFNYEKMNKSRPKKETSNAR